MSLPELKNQGWNIDESALTKVAADSEAEDVIVKGGNALYTFLLDTDLRQISSPGIANASTAKKELQGPIVLQLVSWRNVSYPEASKHDGNNGLCVIRLTDGHQAVKALLFEPISKLDGSTPRGTKVMIDGKVKMEAGFLMLNKKNITVLGGTVEELVEKWKVEKFGGRTGKGATNAPKWVPFGKNKKVDLKIDRNFRAMKVVGKTGENEAEDDEKTAQFKAQRMAQIEALGVAAKDDVVEEVEKKVDDLRISDILNEQNKIKKSYGNDRNERSQGRGRGGKEQRDHGEKREYGERREHGEARHILYQEMGKVVGHQGVEEEVVVDRITRNLINHGKKDIVVVLGQTASEQMRIPDIREVDKLLDIKGKLKLQGIKDNIKVLDIKGKVKARDIEVIDKIHGTKGDNKTQVIKEVHKSSVVGQVANQVQEVQGRKLVGEGLQEVPEDNVEVEEEEVTTILDHLLVNQFLIWLIFLPYKRMSLPELKNQGWNIDESALTKVAADSEAEDVIAKGGNALYTFLLDFGGRTGKGATNAPKWVPFGKNKKVDLKKDRNFRAMKVVGKTGENEAEDDEKTAQFKAQRMAQIEALGVAAKDDVVEEVEKKVDDLRISDILNEQNKIKKSYGNDRNERSQGRGRGGKEQRDYGERREHGEARHSLYREMDKVEEHQEAEEEVVEDLTISNLINHGKEDIVAVLGQIASDQMRIPDIREVDKLLDIKGKLKLQGIKDNVKILDIKDNIKVLDIKGKVKARDIKVIDKIHGTKGDNKTQVIKEVHKSSVVGQVANQVQEVQGRKLVEEGLQEVPEAPEDNVGVEEEEVTTILDHLLVNQFLIWLIFLPYKRTID
ncbi:unnamed protein product [Bursaphelenchus okinawaensis]|uniref:RecQ mediated genome instability protein 1 OB-fold domain-containing protein n=1 Tax=Bursaphelenchus okinawaensis TaxID=465554 RepID=A0A811L6B6_9BILA|nr:unnamed protein product [Bursaphelenchus okinawaensis]CAG9116713.1 unnamed protein product [Bursaphelenchus okinawaensis]